MSRLRFTLRRRDSLDAAARARMLELMELCYENVDAARFAEDLDAKHHVIMLLDGAGTLQGFSTIRMATETLGGRPVDVLFSGDTVIHPDHWGAKALQRGFIAFALAHKLRHPRRRLFWLLLSKGYKTYLLLTNNFPSAFPRVDVTPPAQLRALRDRIACAWWGHEYDPATELLRFTVPRDHVRTAVAALDPAARRHADVAYFLDKNPRWAQGDELVCLAEIDLLLPWRFFTKDLGRRLRSPGNALAPTRAAHGAPPPP